MVNDFFNTATFTANKQSNNNKIKKLTKHVSLTWSLLSFIGLLTKVTWPWFQTYMCTTFRYLRMFPTYKATHACKPGICGQ